MMRVAIVGASDQGAVVIDLIQQMTDGPSVAAVVDSGDRGELVGSKMGGYLISHDLSSLRELVGVIDGLVPAVGAGRDREKIALRAEELNIRMISLVHPTASVATDVRVAAGVVISAGAIVGVGARLGIAVIVNSGAIVNHHCDIQNFSHVGPGAMLAGGAIIGERSWIGIGATVLEAIQIGNDAVVGAGAVVTRNVPAGSTVTGVPARVRHSGGRLE